MIIADRLREMREAKQLSQGDIEKRTGLLRCYISRVENGHTVPAIETLEKIARALEVPLYQVFYDGEEPPKLPTLLKQKPSGQLAWGSVASASVSLQLQRRPISGLREGSCATRQNEASNAFQRVHRMLGRERNSTVSRSRA
jgi:transcriptional regulator with XRE-family HTH domain